MATPAKQAFPACSRIVTAPGKPDFQPYQREKETYVVWFRRFLSKDEKIKIKKSKKSVDRKIKLWYSI